jgi:hypothetical protein
MEERTEMEDIVRVLRLVEYEGPRSVVERQVANSIHGTRYACQVGASTVAWPSASSRMRITAVTLGGYPEVLEEARQTPEPKLIAELNQRIEELEEMIEDAREE